MRRIRTPGSKRTTTRFVPTSTWIAGVIEMPAFVHGEERAPYRPVIALILTEDGLIRGTGVQPPEAVDEAVTAAFMQSLSSPMVGKPGIPRRLIVSTPSLAAFFQKFLPETEIVIGPTPEVDEVATSMRRDFTTKQEDEEAAARSYLTRHATPEDVAGFFAAAADLYERAPWTVVPDDQSVLRFTSKALGVDVIACVIGQMKESFGVLFFDSLDDYDDYRALATRMKSGGPPPLMPPQMALSYERGADVHPARRREVQANRWRVSGPDAYPELMLVEPDLLLRPPTGADYRRVEALCLAFCRLLDRQPDLRRAWDRDDRRTRRFTVDLRGAKAVVSIAIAHAA